MPKRPSAEQVQHHEAQVVAAYGRVFASSDGQVILEDLWDRFGGDMADPVPHLQHNKVGSYRVLIHIQQSIKEAENE